MGGTWLAVVLGFGGFRPRGGVPTFAPILPKKWKRLGFVIRYRGSAMEIRAEHHGVAVRLVDGLPLEIEVYGESYRLEDEIFVPVRER
jgi:trehalose/maltose hydrolase-like predicted phosphorylase